MTFRSDATEGVWSPTQNVAVQTEANVVAIFFFHQCGFYDPTHHIGGCQKIIWNFNTQLNVLGVFVDSCFQLVKLTKKMSFKQRFVPIDAEKIIRATRKINGSGGPTQVTQIIGSMSTHSV